MKPWLALLFTFGLITFCAFASAVLNRNLFTLMILATCLWVAIDSSNIGLQKYKSGISYHPVVLFFACAFLWIVGFPWYLIMRHKIKTGTAILKINEEHAATSIE